MGKYREPQSANEAALQNLLGEQNELREPQSVTEFYLKEILEKGGGGGSGELPVVEEQYDSETNTYFITFENEDCFENETLQPFYVISYYTKYKYLVFPSVSERTLYCSVIYTTMFSAGRVYKITEKTYRYCSWDITSDNYSQTIAVLANRYAAPLPRLEPYNIISSDNSDVVAMTAQEWWNGANIEYDSANVTDLSDAATTLNQVITALKQLSAATPETMVTKYMPLDATYQAMMAQLIIYWNRTLSENKTPIYYALNNGTCAITDVTYATQVNESFATGIYKEIDFTNNKIYDMKITFNQQKLFFQCTCHEATSLM